MDLGGHRSQTLTRDAGARRRSHSRHGPASPRAHRSTRRRRTRVSLVGLRLARRVDARDQRSHRRGARRLSRHGRRARGGDSTRPRSHHRGARHRSGVMRRPERLVLARTSRWRIRFLRAFKTPRCDAAGIPMRYEALDVEPSATSTLTVAALDPRARGGQRHCAVQGAHARRVRRRHAARRARGSGEHFLGGRRGSPRSATIPTSAGSTPRSRHCSVSAPRDLTVGVLGAGGAAAGVLARRRSMAGLLWRTCTTARPSARDCSASDFSSIARTSR